MSGSCADHALDQIVHLLKFGILLATLGARGDHGLALVVDQRTLEDRKTLGQERRLDLVGVLVGSCPQLAADVCPGGMRVTAAPQAPPRAFSLRQKARTWRLSIKGPISATRLFLPPRLSLSMRSDRPLVSSGHCAFGSHVSDAPAGRSITPTWIHCDPSQTAASPWFAACSALYRLGSLFLRDDMAGFVFLDHRDTWRPQGGERILKDRLQFGHALRG